MDLIARYRTLIETELSGLHFAESPRDLYDPIRYSLALGGKRMRPVLVLAGCALFGGDVAKALRPALGMEVFHNFTLLHDDIMDNAPLRRSRETVHAKWNRNVAILSGDTMFVKACQLVMEAEPGCRSQVMDLFLKTAVEVCEGQQLDMDYEDQPQVPISDYIHMITLKTAVLLGASLKMGAILGNAPAADANHLYEFGKCIGISFQLKDDLLDAFGDHDKFGKQIGGDIVSNKKTYLLLRALELASGSERAEMERLLSDANIPQPEKIKGVTGLYKLLGVQHDAEKKMEEFYNEALRHLAAIAVPEPEKETLAAFAGQLMVREA